MRCEEQKHDRYVKEMNGTANNFLDASWIKAMFPYIRASSVIRHVGGLWLHAANLFLDARMTDIQKHSLAKHPMQFLKRTATHGRRKTHGCKET